MKKSALFCLIALTCLLFIVSPCAASADEDINYTIDVMLAQAEDFFTFLNKGRYDAAWSLLSERSHKTIIDDVNKTYQKMGGEIQLAAIEQDFEKGGIIFNNYWKAFMQSVDVLMVLDESRWQAGAMEQSKAEIIITYKNSKNPLKLQMVKEDGLWKVGLVETFWQTRSMDILQAILKFI
ncbi:MAG: hypothetical protein C4581_12085 [Nitrospiraceae bacterium]|nr:MAG: hypothetical protein C4581_12085 [Nitrospiraceae bacterium]